MEKLGLKVSIVSIQADQSRHRNKDGSLKLICDGVSIVSIQADQSRPTYDPYLDRNVDDVSIVSIQADQSRLWFEFKRFEEVLKGFNRINSGRSIPTGEREPEPKPEPTKVSIVSIQADQSRPHKTVKSTFGSYKSFNRINSGRSIPTTQ